MILTDALMPHSWLQNTGSFNLADDFLATAILSSPTSQKSF